MKRNIITRLSIVTVSVLIAASGCQKTGSQSPTEGTPLASGGSVSFVPTVSETESETKAALIAGGEFSTSDVFYVSAWDIAGTSTERFIPAKDAGYTFDKVKYFTTDLKGTPRNSWNTVLPGDDTRLKEYTWKSVLEGSAFHGVDKAFYAYANLPSGTSPVVSVDGTTKLPGAMTFDYETASQEDILVAYYRGEGDVDDKPTGTASLLFLHPLSSVSVTLGTVTGVNKFRINSIGLENVYAGGTLSMTPTGTGSGVTLSWAAEGTTGLSQTVGMDITSETAAGTVLGEPFLVLPQEFGASSTARLAVNVTADGNTFDIYCALKESSWVAGRTHSYAVNYDGHEGIQLWAGGPYWATKNVGAGKPEEAGWYFSWGNVKGFVASNKTPALGGGGYECSWVSVDDPSLTLSGGFSPDAYANGTQGDGNTISGDIGADDAAHDAAEKEMGTKWRMPTEAEFQALIDNTTCVVRSVNGVIGALFTGKDDYSGRSIFLPDCGYGKGAFLLNDATGYWSSTRSTTPANSEAAAKTLKLTHHYEPGIVDEYTVDITAAARRMGRLIRPVENTR